MLSLNSCEVATPHVLQRAQQAQASTKPKVLHVNSPLAEMPITTCRWWWLPGTGGRFSASHARNSAVVCARRGVERKKKKKTRSEKGTSRDFNRGQASTQGQVGFKMAEKESEWGIYSIHVALCTLPYSRAEEKEIIHCSERSFIAAQREVIHPFTLTAMPSSTGMRKSISTAQ